MSGWRSLIVLFWLLLSAPSMAQASAWRSPERQGLALTLGQSYDPSPGFGFLQLSAVAQYDYDRIWPHRAPEPLRFKLEGSLGLADDSALRLIASANMLASYYLDVFSLAGLRPYVEAGIGIAYSDFQVSGQGQRLNFNPQAGIGAEVHATPGRIFFVNLRGYHLSNANLHHDNRGINALLLQFGRYF